MKIDEIDSRWLRVPLPRTIANSTHVLRFIDWIIVEVASGDATRHARLIGRYYIAVVPARNPIAVTVSDGARHTLRHTLFADPVCTRGIATNGHHLLAEGRTICEGTPEAVRRDPAVIREYIGTTQESKVEKGEDP